MAVTFEGYERRIAQIDKACEQYGIDGLEDAMKICTDLGFNPYDITTGIQSIAFENAKWAYTLGCAIAVKKGVKTASEAAAAIGEGLQAFCVPGSVADDRKVGLDRKSTRLNSSHTVISYAVFCLKKKFF